MRKKILILAILALLLLAVLFNIEELVEFTASDKETHAKIRITTKERMKSLDFVLYNYKTSSGNYPTTEEGLRILKEVKLILHIDTLDGWGNKYIYYSPAVFKTQKPYEIISLGADGKFGGEGINKDFNIWDSFNN
ncbi:MAG: hypothetical protein GY754_23015 [bacterium]|nr:hypothetical protein [bacterium]